MSRPVLGVLNPVIGGDPIPLTQDEITIGRRESSDLCLSYPNVSSSHCRLTFRMGSWVIEDLRSANGVKINGERIAPATPTPVKPGDEVTVAKHAFVLDYTPGEGVEFVEELPDIFAQSLMEKAGLQKPKRKRGD